MAGSNTRDDENQQDSLRESDSPVYIAAELQTQIDKMVADLKSWLYVIRAEKQDSYERGRHLKAGYESFKQAANAIGMDFGVMTELYNRTVNESFPPAKSHKKPEPVPVFGKLRGDLWKRTRALYAHGHKFGWTNNDKYDSTKILEFLRTAFHVKTADKLSPEQFAIAWRRLEQGPPKPN